MDWLNRNLVSARNAVSANQSHAPLQYIIMQFYHFCGTRSFVSDPLVQFAPLQQAYKTARPDTRPSLLRRGRPGGSASDLAAEAGSGRLQGCCGRGGGGGCKRFRQSPPGAHRSHLPRVRRRRRCRRLRRHGHPCRRRPPRPRLRLRCGRSKLYSGKLPKASQIMSNAVTLEIKSIGKQWDIMGVARSNTHANLQDSQTIECPCKIHRST